MKKKNKNKFNNDTERILELKTCLEECLMLIDSSSYENDMRIRTLIRDVLSRYKDDLKFCTANTVVDGMITYIND